MTRSVKLALGIDIGGTKIRGVIFDGRRVLARSEARYRRKPPTKKEFFKALFSVADALLQAAGNRKVAGIGIGTAGRIVGTGVLPSLNLGAARGRTLFALLKKRYRLPVKIQNDAKTAALAESRLGAAKKSRSIVMITLGSGLGGAYIKDGQLQTGSFSSAYEIGSIIIDAGRSRKGERGDFEWFCSEKFFTSKGIDPIRAEQKARKGNLKMARLWQDFGESLGIGITNLIHVFEPEVFVIGGGMAEAWPLFAPKMRKTVRKFYGQLRTKIVRAKLSRDAGAIGAGLLIHSRG